MLQQLHGVTMYSHDEHHSTTSYCWSDRGKGASAANASPAVLLTTLRPSVRQTVRPSCGPVSSKAYMKCLLIYWKLLELVKPSVQQFIAA